MFSQLLKLFPRTEFQALSTRIAQVFGGDKNQVAELSNKCFTDENGWGNFTLAVSMGFDELGKIMTTPSAGRSCAAVRRPASTSGRPS